jgi:Leucine-rich repeat (LRR) protein
VGVSDVHSSVQAAATPPPVVAAFMAEWDAATGGSGSGGNGGSGAGGLSEPAAAATEVAPGEWGADMNGAGWEASLSSASSSSSSSSSSAAAAAAAAQTDIRAAVEAAVAALTPEAGGAARAAALAAAVAAAAAAEAVEARIEAAAVRARWSWPAGADGPPFAHHSGGGAGDRGAGRGGSSRGGFLCLDLSAAGLLVVPERLAGRDLESLTDLDLSRNRLEELATAPDGASPLAPLAQLRRLSLRENRLGGGAARGRLASFVFARLTGLISLDLSANQLAALPAAIGGLSRLEVLDVSCNALTALPPELAALQRLSALAIHSNRLPAELHERLAASGLSPFLALLRTLPASPAGGEEAE